MYHYLKCDGSYYDAIQDGRKNFEVRLNDRGFQAGDIITLTRTGEPSTADRAPFLSREITYVFQGGQFGLEPQYCVLGLAAVASRGDKP
ncbi:bacteriophage P2 associated protein [Agrobacterium vitis]|uniref:DUF3850 domain-containing protein n=1 Tax=Agrobacterium vitis TaxID=373 RepID=UPI0015D7B950|nr:DUF3850 domain-containing protein [Agrobacterium vitis]BCH59180.1 bacteriophage P2 associated protein [Agrobacterium vitis]